MRVVGAVTHPGAGLGKAEARPGTLNVHGSHSAPCPDHLFYTRNRPRSLPPFPPLRAFRLPGMRSVSSLAYSAIWLFR